MRFYWLQDRSKQGQFNIYWSPGTNNLADYYTKNFSDLDHIQKQHLYLYEPYVINFIYGHAV